MSECNEGTLDYKVEREKRLKAEREAEAIQARIRLLKFEHNRALKRISETRKRIEKVDSNKKRYLSQRRAETGTFQMNQADLEVKQEKIKQEREYQTTMSYLVKTEMFNVKQLAGKRFRGYKDFVKRKLQQQDIEQKRRNKQKHDAIVLNKQTGAMRKRLITDTKVNRQENSYNRHIEFIEKKKQQDQNALLELKEQERLLIESIEKEQEEHQSALRDMSSVLGHY